MPRAKRVPATIERSEIEPHLNEMRIKHPMVTDFQADVVTLFIHLGLSPPKIAQQMHCDVQKVRYHMEKAHVVAYRHELAMLALGWDAALAQHTLASLLRSKSDYVRLEAAKDIASRAGLGMDRGVAPAVAVQLNFGVTPPLAQTEPRQGGGAGRGDAIPPPAAKHGSG